VKASLFPLHGYSLKLYRRRILFFGGSFKKRFLLEAKHRGDDDRGKCLDTSVQFGDVVVVKLAGESDAVFRAGQFFLEREKILVRFQFRIGFRDREQSCNRRTELAFRFDHVSRE